jgi:carbon-monoxide dehydrogenase medium subunit
MLCEVAAAIAYRSVRNRGTIGGGLAHADPAADWPLALAALGASVNVRGPTPRNILVAHFIQGAFTTTLAANEIIESIDVPKLSRAGRYGFYKFCRKTGEFAEASAAAVFDPESGVASIFLGALRGTPQPLTSLAQQVARQGKTAASTEAVSQALAQSVSGLDAVEHGMATAVVTRALMQVFAP